jgi:hypothetical protein
MLHPVPIPTVQLALHMVRSHVTPLRLVMRLLPPRALAATRRHMSATVTTRRVGMAARTRKFGALMAPVIGPGRMVGTMAAVGALMASVVGPGRMVGTLAAFATIMAAAVIVHRGAAVAVSIAITAAILGVGDRRKRDERHYCQRD